MGPLWTCEIQCYIMRLISLMSSMGISRPIKSKSWIPTSSSSIFNQPPKSPSIPGSSRLDKSGISESFEALAGSSRLAAAAVASLPMLEGVILAGNCESLGVLLVGAETAAAFCLGFVLFFLSPFALDADGRPALPPSRLCPLPSRSLSLLFPFVLLTRDVPRPDVFRVPPVMLPTTSSSNNSLCFTLFVHGSSFANGRSEERWLLARAACDTLTLWTDITVLLSANKTINQIMKSDTETNATS
jgi:hypothetical protein